MTFAKQLPGAVEPLTCDDIHAAAERIKDHVLATPCTHSEPLSEHTGLEVYCKQEYLQRTGSFKERGAVHALMLLSGEQKRRGVITASAGNHAWALSCHGSRFGIAVMVVMPRFAPLTKLSNCRRQGAQVVLHGDNLEEACAYATQLGQERGWRYVSG